MKFLPTSCLLAALLFALPTLADPSPSTTVSSPPTTTHHAKAITHHPHLEARQGGAGGVGLVDPAATIGAVAGAGQVTNYNINSQVGPSSAVQVDIVYTQTFAKVPDQWPSAKAGVIGLGDLKKRAVVEAEATMVEEAKVVQTGAYVQPVVVQMVTEVVTVPVKRTTSVLVVETVTVGGNYSISANGTMANGTALGSYGTMAGSVALGTGRPLYTATGMPLYTATRR